MLNQSPPKKSLKPAATQPRSNYLSVKQSLCGHSKPLQSWHNVPQCPCLPTEFAVLFS